MIFNVAQLLLHIFSLLCVIEGKGTSMVRVPDGESGRYLEGVNGDDFVINELEIGT